LKGILVELELKEKKFFHNRKGYITGDQSKASVLITLGKAFALFHKTTNS